MNLSMPLAMISAADSGPPSGQAANSRPAGDFSRVFSEALTQTLTESAASGASGGVTSLPLGGAASLPLGGAMDNLQYSLLAEVAGGAGGDQDMLMYMLMLMMREFSHSDPTPMLAALAVLAPASSAFTPGESQTAPNLHPSKLSYRGAPLSSGFLPVKAWLPTSLRVAGNAENRNAGTLRQVINQFNVESAERYRPNRNGKTYCNIFLWDVTRALDCEIPHYVDRVTGQPRIYPDTAGAYELDASGTHDWLLRHGEDHGWYEVGAEQAQYHANAGYPAVTAWKNNGGGAGHVQVVCPAQNGGYDAARGVTVAQAGSKNFSYAHLNATMSRDKISDVRYFIHA